MSEKDIQTMICNLRCNCEEIRGYVRKAWTDNEISGAVYEYYEMELGYIAERIEELETEEE